MNGKPQYYVCPLCQKKINRDLLLFNAHTEQHILDVIKKDHPDWAAQDGTCKKCADYYKKARNAG